MASPFDDFFKRAIAHEGKVCEDVPGDRGGPTKWGVTLGRYAESIGAKTPRRGSEQWDLMKDELFALDEAAIKQIYKRDYWDAVRADSLPLGVGYAVADYALNSGPSRAIHALQKICGNDQSSMMDDETIREAGQFQPVELIMLYCDERARFLNAIVDGNASQRKFLKGWLARVGDVRRAAIKDAEKVPSTGEDKPLPKAEPPAVPGHVETARKSVTTRLGLGGVLLWIEEQFGLVREMLPNASGEAHDLADPLTALGGLIRVNWAAIIAGITLVILVVMVVRHHKDKRLLNALKGQ